VAGIVSFVNILRAKVIIYQALCGIRLHNMEDLHRYLRITDSTLSVDLFDFDYWVRAFMDFVVEKCFIHIKVDSATVKEKKKKSEVKRD